MQIDSGKRPKKIVADFKICISDVSEIKKNRSSILLKLAFRDYNAQRIINPATSFEIIDKDLLERFRSVRASSEQIIRGCDLLEKFQEFAISLGYNLSISISWINR